MMNKSLMLLAGVIFAATCQAQTGGSVRVAGEAAGIDHRGEAIQARPVPEDFDPTSYRLERPPSVFFGEAGLLIDAESSQAEAGPWQAVSDEQPEILEAPLSGPDREANETKKRGFFKRLFGR